MRVQLESLEFEIQTSAEQAARGVDALAESLGRLRTASRNLSGLSKTAERLKELSNSVSGMQTDTFAKLATAMENMARVGKFSISASIPKRIAEIGEALKTLDDDGIERLNRLADGLRNMEGLRGPAARLTQAINNTTNNGPRRNDITRSPGGIQQTLDDAAGKMDKNRFSEFGKQMEKTTLVIAKHLLPFKEVSTIFREIGIKSQWAAIGVRAFLGAWSVLIGILKKVINFLGKVLNLIKKVGASVGKMLLSPFVKIGSTVKSMGEKVKQLFESLKRIALYRLIRSAIKALSQAIQEGIHNLYQYSRLVGTDFAKSMDKIATASLYVKNSLAAMVSPLINQVAPIIDNIGDKLAEIANKVNIFISRLLGKSTYTAAKKLQTTFEEIKSAVIGIDELNIIGDGEKDYAQMFQELPITGESSFVDKLRELFENADWKELGKFLGSKVNELIDMIDWKEIGKNIGNLFDAIFQTIYGFLSEVDTEKLGQGVADLLTEFLKAIDWKNVGRLMVRQITIVWDFLIGFFESLDWGEVAKSLFDLLSGALDEIHDWLKKYDWLDLGEKILENLKDFFANFDFKELLKHFFTVMGEAVKAMKDLLTPLWNAFKAWWNEHIKGKDFIETIKNLIDYLLKFFDENIITPFMKGFLGDDQVEGSGLQQLKELGENILAGILQGITDWLGEKLNDWIKNRLFGPFLNGLMFVFGIHSPAETMIPIGENIMLGILEGMVRKIGEVLESITNFCINIINAFSEGLSTLITTVADIAAQVITAFGEGLAGIVTAGSEAVSQVVTAIGTGLSGMVTAASEAASQIVTALGSGLSGMVSTAAEAASQVTEALGTGLAGMISATSEAASQVVTALGSGLAGMVSAASGAAANVVSALGSGLAGMISATSGAASQVVSALGGGLAGMISATASAASQVVSALGAGLAGMIGATAAAAAQVVSALGAGLAGMIGAATSAAAGVVSALAGGLAGMISAASSAVAGVLEAISSGFSQVISSVANAASSIVSAFAIGKLSQSVNDLSDSLSRVPKEVQVDIKYNDPGWEPPANATVTVNIVYNDPGWSASGHATGGILTAPTFFHAVGGIVDRPTFFHAKGGTHVMGEAGREAILPLQNHTEWMTEVAERTREAMAADEPDETAFYSALGRFFNEYLSPVMTEISADTKRQADKKEATVVKIGNKDIKTAYDTQKKADGYSFRS